ncbi:hypothetical protein [Myxococcus qinghaiensis]|uniref:hypothetical protein n=1 Tax=Myxococcus qinghaiensis TaxID=2906758 RepID=UPI0020A7B7E9|nr:hypothetical protein [Myxococcus qinghaiensis]MCP3162977.1 hypothetical protein [Myxococcus qinghaiensis]
MPSVRLLLVPLALVLGSSARAQQAPARNPTPDESWSAPTTQVDAPRKNDPPDDATWTDFPGGTSVPTGADAAPLPRLPEVPPLVPLDDDDSGDGSFPRILEPRPPAPPPGPPPVANRVSLLGARTVGRTGGVAVGLSLGFPTLSARAAFGVLPQVDALVGLDSLYGMMNEARLGWRWRVLDGGPRWSLGLVMEGSHAFFLRSASQEDRGARYLTGRRNWNIMPGIVGTFQRQGVRASRLFIDVRYLVALDTEPIQRTPLGGLPPDLVSSSAWPVRVGAEVPLSEKTSYSVTLGGDFRTRAEDAAFMPVVSVGIVTGL